MRFQQLLAHIVFPLAGTIALVVSPPPTFDWCGTAIEKGTVGFYVVCNNVGEPCVSPRACRPTSFTMGPITSWTCLCCKLGGLDCDPGNTGMYLCQTLLHFNISTGWSIGCLDQGCEDESEEISFFCASEQFLPDEEGERTMYNPCLCGS